MREYRSLVLTIIAIFIVTLIGAYFSPTFNEQKTYLELFFLFGALLFIFSILIIFASIGFSSFSFYLALFLAIVMVMYGVEGALFVIGMTYFFWGSIFAMEVLLFYHHLKSAKEWFISRYTFKTFKNEYYTFYPMMGMLYILLEFIPHFLFRENLLGFSPSKVLKEMEEILKPE